MGQLAYAAAPDLRAAIAMRGRTHGAEFIAGGTDMLQLLEEHVRVPNALIDISRLPLAGIAENGGGLRIGALTRLADVANDARVQNRYTVVAEALLATASPQVRNMATVGGNLLQRTRCLYFRDATMPCNKRAPGSGCPAQEGMNRVNAILGGSADCIATYPGDLATALLAVDAELAVEGPAGERRLPVAELHREPGETPHIETVLDPAEIIIAVLLPASPPGRRSHYFKVRDRASFEWAIASSAVALDMDGGTVRAARVAAGGVATKPWRLRQVEDALSGESLSPELCARAASRASDGAVARGGNAYKIPLLRNTVERALLNAGGLP